MKTDCKEQSIIPDKKYPNMYRVQWPDGVLSEDFYNLARAKEHLRNILEKERKDSIQKAVQKPLEARGCV